MRLWLELHWWKTAASDQYIDEDDYYSIIIMQDDGIHAILTYTHQAYVAWK